MIFNRLDVIYGSIIESKKRIWLHKIDSRIKVSSSKHIKSTKQSHLNFSDAQSGMAYNNVDGSMKYPQHSDSDQKFSLLPRAICERNVSSMS